MSHVNVLTRGVAVLTLPRLNVKDAGFSLLEILIVVAIIGILAAIAIPQFALYRLRAFDSAALSDIVNLQKSQVSISLSGQQFGQTINTGAPVAVLGNGVILQGAGTQTDGLANLQVFMPISLSHNVGVAANTDAVGGTYLLLSKHLSGIRVYAIDSDMSGAYFSARSTGLSLAASGVNVLPVQSSNDFPLGGGWTPL